MTDKATTGQAETGKWSTLAMLNICLGLFVLLSAIFLCFPDIDMKVAALFFEQDRVFWLSRSTFTAWMNDFIRDAVRFFIFALLLFFLVRWFTLPIGRVREMARLGFFLICIVLATGLVVHGVFKENWGRARPKHVELFGGDKEFTPPLIVTDQCTKNCSFVSGDASLGYVTLALALFAQRRRKAWILASIGAGLGMGLLRMMNGSHFLSDILFSGIFTCGSVLILYRWIVEKRLSDDLGFLAPVLRPFWVLITSLIPKPRTKIGKSWRTAVRARLTGLFA